MSAGAFPAVGGTRGEPGIALAADLLLAVVFGGQDLQRRLNDTTAETVNRQERVNGAALWTVEILTGEPSEGWTPSGCCWTEMLALFGSRFPCNSLIRKGAPVLQLLSGKDETLLIGGDTIQGV